MTENEESFKKEIHTLLNTAKRDWFVNPKDIWNFFGSLFFCCTVFTTVGKSGGKVTPTEPNATRISLMYFFQGIRLKDNNNKEKEPPNLPEFFSWVLIIGLQGVLQTCGRGVAEPQGQVRI